MLTIALLLGMFPQKQITVPKFHIDGPCLEMTKTRCYNRYLDASSHEYFAWQNLRNPGKIHRTKHVPTGSAEWKLRHGK